MARVLVGQPPLNHVPMVIDLDKDDHSEFLGAVYDLLANPQTNWKSVTITHGYDGDYTYTLQEPEETSVEIG